VIVREDAIITLVNAQNFSFRPAFNWERVMGYVCNLCLCLSISGVLPGMVFSLFTGKAKSKGYVGGSQRFSILVCFMGLAFFF